MHRGNFRAKTQYASARPLPAARAEDSPRLMDELREQIANISKDIAPIRGTVERLATPKKDITVPEDVAQSLGEAHNRLDRVEKELDQVNKQLQRMSSTFSNALLKLGDKVEKIAGVEDSKFSLAHSLETLISVLTNRKLRIIRDRDGNMSELEPDMSSFEGEKS